MDTALTDTTPASRLAHRVQARLDAKTKPPGSLGRLEALAVALAVAQNREDPVADAAVLLLFAADHGLVEAGVSAWPQAVTAQMVANFRAGGAAANVLAAAHGLDLVLVDAGVAADLAPGPDLVDAKIRPGTRNALTEDAMTAQERDAAMARGAQLAQDAVASGADILCLGEMGIGNTSSATLIAHALIGAPIADLTGRGAGLDDAGLAHKIEVLERCAARRPDARTGAAALAAFGGFEIAMMAGAVHAAAQLQRPVIVDGFIATAAALVAVDMAPDCRRALIFAHRSAEPGHDAMLAALKADPLLDLSMRLGEGTGAVLAVPLLRAACAILRDMATFESAGVSGAAP